MSSSAWTGQRADSAGIWSYFEQANLLATISAVINALFGPL
jgi:hypothetical protein